MLLVSHHYILCVLSHNLNISYSLVVRSGRDLNDYLSVQRGELRSTEVKQSAQSHMLKGGIALLDL